MTYHFTTTASGTIDEVEARVRERLSEEGFGIITFIDAQATLKEKIDVDFRPYRILGACNPRYAHRALQTEDKIGTMLPCNVVVQEQEGGQVEVTAIDPLASMTAVDNDDLKAIAAEVREKLQRVIEGL